MTDYTSLTATLRSLPQHGPSGQNPQAGQTANQVLSGHNFGNIDVHERAVAHIGDAYNTYHIHNTINQSSSEIRSSLTIGDALRDIIIASDLLRTMFSTDAAHSSPILIQIREEFTNLQIIVQGLQGLLDYSSSLNVERTGLIKLESLVVVMTQLLLLIPDFKVLVNNSVSRRPRRWFLASETSATALQLLGKLQRHKSTLSLVLQIIQCQTSIQAQSQAWLLNELTRTDLEGDPTLARRLSHLGPTEDAGDETASTIRMPWNGPHDKLATESADNSVTVPKVGNGMSKTASALLKTSDSSIVDETYFGTIVAQSRVYRRVEHRETDAASTCRSTRSHGWSMISGLSASQVTCVSVIRLPLDENELACFQRCLFTPRAFGNNPDTEYLSRDLALPVHCRRCVEIRERLTPDEVNTQRRKPLPAIVADHRYVKRIEKEMRDSLDYFCTHICASPLEHDMGHWRVTIEGAKDTPFEGGLFRLDIHFPPQYPFCPPKCTFRTKIYHPNIDDKGNLSLDMLSSKWKPTLHLSTVLWSISMLLDDPDVDEPLVPEIASRYKNDRAAYNAEAQKWTRLYATKAAEFNKTEFGQVFSDRRVSI